MINLGLGIGVAVLIGIVLYSYFVDAETEIGKDLSDRNFRILLMVLIVWDVYLIGTGIYQWLGN